MICWNIQRESWQEKTNPSMKKTEEELLNEFLDFDSEPKKIKEENRRKKKF